MAGGFTFSRPSWDDPRARSTLLAPMHGSLGDLDLDALLRQRAWLRGLALALVGPDAADDLVQETWVTALDSSTGPHVYLRAWLAGIVRNLARRERRRHDRRSELVEP